MSKDCGCQKKTSPEQGPALACVHCLDMHMAYALELAYEPAASEPLSEERFLLIGTLRAAQDHAAALGRPALAARIRALRLALDAEPPLPRVPAFVRAYLAERRSESLATKMDI